MKPLPLLLLAAALALLIWATRGKRVVATDGRTYRQSSPGDPTGNGPVAIWRTVPDDGMAYTPDLSWQQGLTSGAPIMRRLA